MKEAGTFLVHYVRATGGPMWGVEAGGAAFANGGWRGRLTKGNGGEDAEQRFRVFAVPPEHASLSLESLIQAARAGAIEKIFEDRALLQKWGLESAKAPAAAPSPVSTSMGGAS